MVGTDLPECAFALHPVKAYQRIHDGLLEAVTHVQCAGHIGGGNGNAIGTVSFFGRKIVFRLPLGIPVGFDCRRRKRFIHDVLLPYRQWRLFVYSSKFMLLQRVASVPVVSPGTS